jgi:diguanylate cyclase (GGDEF)-like protein
VETIPGARPTESSRQPLLLTLAAVHLGIGIGLPLLGDLNQVSFAIAGDLIAGLIALAVAGIRGRKSIDDPALLAALLVAAAATTLRLVALRTPWAGADFAVILAGAGVLGARRRARELLLGFAALWLLGLGIAAGETVADKDVDVAWPGWFLAGGSAIAVTIVVLAMQAGLASLERTLDAVRDQADSDSVHDQLTGVANRAGLLMVAQPMLEQARRKGEALHCLYLDIDDLRGLNAGFGSGRGDRALAGVAELLRGSVRGTDVVARWQDDEFVAVGPGTGTSPLDLERRIKARLSNLVDVPAESWPARVSVGSATLVPWDEADLETLLGRAEKDMRLRRSLRRQTASRGQAPSEPTAPDGNASAEAGAAPKSTE